MTMSDCLYDGESPALPSPTSMPPSPELYLPSSPDHLQPRTTTKSSAKKSTSKYIPHSEKPPQLVERRNARERRRVESVNSAFVRLRRIVPYENRHKRLSKAKTLRTAINYISHLKQLIDQYDMQQQQQQPQHPHHQNGMMLPCAQSAYYPAYMKDLEGPSLGMPCTERQMDSIERQTQGCPDEHTLAWLRQQRQQVGMDSTFILPLYQPGLTEMAKTLGSTSIRRRWDTKFRDWCLIDVDPRVFAIWVSPCWQRWLRHVNSGKMCWISF